MNGQSSITGGESIQPPHRFENNRRYNNRSDVVSILPDDEIDNDRVHQQHWLLKLLFDGNFIAPVQEQLQNGINVLDSGCGPGTWAMEMAFDYPKSKFVGTDVSPRFPESVRPLNCDFIIHHLASPAPFSNNHFGLIHQRFLIAALRVGEWDTVIKEHFRTLSPGGWLELTEYPITKHFNVGPKLGQFLNAFCAFLRSRDLNLDITDSLEDMLHRAGFVNIQVKETVMVINDGTTIGRMAWEDIKEAYAAVKPVLLDMISDIRDEEDYDQWLNEAAEEAKVLKTGGVIYRIYGQKPIEL